MPVNG